MGALPLSAMTESEYFLFEAQSKGRHEYYRGEVFAMAGGSVEHAQIIGNVAGELRQRLKGQACQASGSDLRIHIEAAGLYTYPDVSVVCDQLQYYNGRKDTIINPVVLIEVLSPNTESYDRGEQFNFYRKIPTLQEYILISSTKMQVQHFRLQSGGQWLLTIYNQAEEELLIDSIQELIPLKELYDRVALG